MTGLEAGLNSTLAGAPPLGVHHPRGNGSKPETTGGRDHAQDGRSSVIERGIPPVQLPPSRTCDEAPGPRTRGGFVLSGSKVEGSARCAVVAALYCSGWLRVRLSDQSRRRAVGTSMRQPSAASG